LVGSQANPFDHLQGVCQVTDLVTTVPVAAQREDDAHVFGRTQQPLVRQFVAAADLQSHLVLQDEGAKPLFPFRLVGLLGIRIQRQDRRERRVAEDIDRGGLEAMPQDGQPLVDPDFRV